MTQISINRDAATAGTGGGGAVRATCPHNLEAVGALPPTLDCQCRSFLFLFVHVNFGLSQKIVGETQGVFSFG